MTIHTPGYSCLVFHLANLAFLQRAPAAPLLHLPHLQMTCQLSQGSPVLFNVHWPNATSWRSLWIRMKYNRGFPDLKVVFNIKQRWQNFPNELWSFRLNLICRSYFVTCTVSFIWEIKKWLDSNSPSFTKPQRAGGFSPSLGEKEEEC